MVAIDVRWWMLGFGWIELKSDPPLQIFLKVDRRPAMPQEKKLQPRSLAMFAQWFGITKQFRDSLDYRQNLIPANESVQRSAEIRLGGKSAAHSQCETCFRFAVNYAPDRCQSYVVDLRVGAPDAASGDRDLELARQVVELGISRQHAIRFEGQGRSVANLVRIHASDRAPGNIARDVPAGTDGIQADSPEFFQHFGKISDCDPVQLNVLAHRKIGCAAGVTAREMRDGSKLVGSQETVRNPNPEHKERDSLPLAALASNNAGAVTLRVDPPPAEVGADPFGRRSSRNPLSRSGGFRPGLPTDSWRASAALTSALWFL